MSLSPTAAASGLQRLLAITSLALALVRPGLAAAEFGGECPVYPNPADPRPLVVGMPVNPAATPPPGFDPLPTEYNCIRVWSDHMGGLMPVAYYIPPATTCDGTDPACTPDPGCDPGHPWRPRCPALYFLHGTGVRYHALYLHPSENALIPALTHGPPVDPDSVDDPWNYADVSQWKPAEPIPMVLIGPYGLTLPPGEGYGPHRSQPQTNGTEGQDLFWADANPRHAKDGSDPLYDTPPARLGSFVREELIPLVDRHFPVIADRRGRAINGNSQGGFGAFFNAFLQPDLFASAGMVSGGTLPTYSTDDPVLSGSPLPVGIAPPFVIPHTQFPATASVLAPDRVRDQFIVAQATEGFGDPIGDGVWIRGQFSLDHFRNARAHAIDSVTGEKTQSIHLDYFVNDSISRIPGEPLEGYYPTQQFFESVLFPLNLYMETLFDRHGIERGFDVHPGIHYGPYWQPFFRQLVETHHEHLRQRDGGGTPPPDPDVFDYRTIRKSFTIWGWKFRVERSGNDWLRLDEVTCAGLTLRGTGVVTFTVPATCGTGLAGNATVIVDLGPSQATDEPAGISGLSAWGQTRTITLEALPP